MLNEGLTYLKSILPEQKIITFAFSIILSALIITLPSNEHSSILEAISEVKINEIVLYRDGAIGSLTIGDIFLATLITILSKIITNALILISYRSITALLSKELESRFEEWKEKLKESEISTQTAKEIRNRNIEKLHAMKELLIIPNTIMFSFIFLIYMSSSIDWVFWAALFFMSLCYSAKLSIYFLENVFTYETIIRIRKEKEPVIPKDLKH